MSDYGDDSRSIFCFGVEIVTKLCEKLVSSGVPGIHFYSMNKSEAIIEIYKNLEPLQ